MPETVANELKYPEAPPRAREWIASVRPWIAIRPDPAGLDADLQSLDDGERAAIILALALDADLILMDDRKGVAIARRKGFAVAGTLGLLDIAARRGLVDLAQAFATLRDTTFRYRPGLLDEILAKHSRRSSS